MSGSQTPDLSEHRVRASAATALRCKEWLASGSTMSTQGQSRPVSTQLFPQAKLREKLAASEKPMANTTNRSSHRETTTENMNELSPVITLVTSEHSAILHSTPSPAVDGTHQAFKDEMHTKPENGLCIQLLKAPEGGGRETRECEKESPLDFDAPFPTPLHLIEALMSPAEVIKAKTKLGSPTWELSSLGSASKHEQAVCRLPRSDDEDSNLSEAQEHGGEMQLVPTGVQAPMVPAWLQNTTRAPIAKFLYTDSRALSEISRKCDIDTFTGELLPAIEYPDTQNHQLDGPCRSMGDIAWRQANMTSELRIQRELLSRERLAGRLRAAAVTRAQETICPPVEDAWPRARCMIRPATRDDFPAIALIMNLERQKPKRPQLVESRTIGIQDLESTFNYCRSNMRPFIVAVSQESELLDRSRWPMGEGADEDYNEYVRFKKAQLQKSSAQPTVLGFAFVTEPRVGFLGSGCSGSLYSGLIKLLVHPAHRQKLYGSALLDRILLSVALYHRSLVDYNWECSDPALIYERPAIRNRRLYTRVHIETIFNGKDDPDIEWMTKLLDKFEFQRVACFEQALKTDRGVKSEWLDLVVWERHTRSVEEIRA